MFYRFSCLVSQIFALFSLVYTPHSLKNWKCYLPYNSKDIFCLSVSLQSSLTVQSWCSLNTFTATVDLSWFNNSRLKSPASTLADLIFQSCSFSFNQLRDLSLLAGNLYSSFSISSWRYPIHSLLCLHSDIMKLCLSLCSEGEWAVSGCSL